MEEPRPPDPTPLSPAGSALPFLRELCARPGDWKPTLWGELSGMPLPDLLGLLAHGRRSGLLLVRGADGTERALALLRGEVTWAASTAAAELGAQQVTFALVRLTQGTFTLLRAPEGALPQTDPVPVQELLLDGLRRLDEEREGDGACLAG